MNQRKPLMVKSGMYCYGNIEKLAFMVLTTSDISIVFAYSNRTELLISHKLLELKLVHRLAVAGVFNTLSFLYDDGKSFAFRFENEEVQKEISRRIVRMSKFVINEGKSFAKNLIYHKTMNPTSLIQIQGLQQSWVNSQLSSFDYLSIVNYLAGRAGYNYNLHPIAPCVLASFTGPKPTLLTGTFFNKHNKSLLSGTQ
jgi:Beige/BEACH domain